VLGRTPLIGTHHWRSSSSSADDAADTLKVAQLVEDFRARGHLVASLDPLKRALHGPWQAESAAWQAWGCGHLSRVLDIYSRGGTRLAADLEAVLGLQAGSNPDRVIDLGGMVAGSTLPGGGWRLPDLVGHLCTSYCGPLAVESAHLTSRRQRKWLEQRAESQQPLGRADALSVLATLTHTDALERFLDQKFPKQKRFGIEGCEAVLPGLQALAAASAAAGVRRIEVAAPHRGRLNLLVTLLGKPPGQLFAEMEGAQSEFHVGDVKYHTGQAATLEFPRKNGSSQRVRVSIAPNPSHLEAVAPVVLGMVRAEQTRRILKGRQGRSSAGASNGGRAAVMGLVLHGDAAFAGQGVVAETLQLGNLPGFSTGGSVHVVINNQVGFTTVPGEARSSPHCTDMAKGLGIPVLHANADDPEAVVRACRIAAEWRAEFGRDIIVDICGYRRHGHNEMDDPRATMPLTCAAIDTHPRVLQLYSNVLATRFEAASADLDRFAAQQSADAFSTPAASADGACAAAEAAADAHLDVPALVARWHEGDSARFQREYGEAMAGVHNVSPAQFVTSSWQGDALQAWGEDAEAAGEQRQEPTGLPLSTLKWMGRAIATLPPNFEAHPSVQKLSEARRGMVEDAASRVDWAMGEALAFGTLMLHRGAGLSVAAPRPLPEAQAAAESEAAGHHRAANARATAAFGQPQQAASSIRDPPLQQPRTTPESHQTQQAHSGQRNGSGNGNGDATTGLNFGHYGVRLCGQDSERGTFNQRHAAIYDQHTGERHTALNAVKPGSQNYLEVCNTPLSEAASAAFEYGFSLGSRGRVLTVWEAQFGDFCNGAQICIDQFIAAGEERWGQQSGLVVMAPHGAEGQGPDHSSCRLERFLQLANDDADSLPGNAPGQRRQMRTTFQALARDHGGSLPQSEAAQILGGTGVVNAERASTLWAEMGLQPHEPVTGEVWERLMTQWLRRNAEAAANIFVVNATTPAQLFHVLRRQMNRPYAKPLILATPKWLLHHRRATSALQDFTTGKYFNRVIDDGKASDNTRHLARHSVTGEAHLLPQDQIRRVLLVSGQIYYQLSRARQARKIRDVVLVRLEQIAPFPHDIITRIIAGYPNAEVRWCQEEPKNMGAWSYVKPRLETALRTFAGADDDPAGYSDVTARRVQYIGRPTAASPATASLAIHRAETAELIDAALSVD